MNVMFARKDLHNEAVYRNIKELTLETNLMNVMFAT